MGAASQALTTPSPFGEIDSIGAGGTIRGSFAEAGIANRRVLLEGVDQARVVEIGADYLARTNPHSDAPALQHAYAITTYSAQGTTVDRAYVAADASMDKQELYVAASRSRGETLIYATPEIRADRMEIAPADHPDRGALAHISEAAVRDRAQRAAHDLARLEALPTAELRQRLDDLAPTAHHELAAVEEVLAARARMADTAVRLVPPGYLVSELGERPTDPAKAKTWDRGAAGIERYRERNGVTDRERAFGAEPKDGASKARRSKEIERMERVRRQLGREQERQRTREMSSERGLGLGP